MKCPLCQKSNPIFYQRENLSYHHCQDCDFYYMNDACFLEDADERSRYLNHQNDPEEIRYSQYLNQILTEIKPFIDRSMVGLDYGTGPTVSLARVLTEQGYPCDYYDKYFFPEIKQSHYDYLILCEVIEHFKNLSAELNNLKNLLTYSKHIFIKTQMCLDEEFFKNWYYPRDPTHVIFFTENSMEILAKKLEMKLIKLSKNIFMLSKL
jgi:hypothetical protein